MGGGYKIDKQDGIYFTTSTVVGWVDLFIRDTYKKILADSLNFCIKYKGLNVHAYVFMSSHIHMVVSANNNNLSQIMCDFKKFTSTSLIREILTLKESRREWMVPIFKEAGLLNSKNTHFQIWQNGNHPKETFSPQFTEQKIRYIHQNPVKEGIVLKAEEYLYSSARDYIGLKSPVNTKKLLFDSFGRIYFNEA